MLSGTHNITPKNEKDLPDFLYYVTTSGGAVGVSGDGIFTVSSSTLKILKTHHIQFTLVNPPKTT